MNAQQARALTLIPEKWATFEKIRLPFSDLLHMAELDLIDKRVRILTRDVTRTEFRRK